MTAISILSLRPMSGNTGAEVFGIDISKPLGKPAVEAILEALDRWKVVFFRDCGLDHASHIAFAQHFGELTYAHPHDDRPPEQAPQIYTLDPRRFEREFGIDTTQHDPRFSYSEGWHTDVTPAVNPPAGSILRAEVVPEYGGDTIFTNLVAAYEGLSAPVQAFVDGLRAEHHYGARSHGWGAYAVDYRKSGSYSDRLEEKRLVAHHPVVRVHPRTGEKGLFVNPVFTDHVLGVSPVESQFILSFLFDHLSSSEYTVRFRWEPGSVAFWDNRATAHIGPQDLGHMDVERIMHRVTLVGEVPIGPDGTESELVEGSPFRSAPVFMTAQT